MKSKFFNPDLEAERKRIAFDQPEMERFIMGEQTVADIEELNAFLTRSHGEMGTDLNFYEMTREE